MSDAILGRTAVVTGGGSGLGRAIALSLAARGADVVLFGRDLEKMEAVCDEVRRLGPSARSVACDVSNPAGVDAASTVLGDTAVSILVNNAGVPGPVAPLTEIDPDEWDEVFAVNVRGVYLLSRAFLPAMIRRGAGDIVNISSVAAKRPLAARTPYGASKAAVLGLTATLAVEVAPFGVRVNSLSPGPIDGPRMDRNFALEAARRGISIEQARADYVDRSATGRMVTEREVGDAVVGIIGMTGLIGADIDLSAGMIAR